VLIEEFIDGIDVAVGFIEGVGHDDGLLTPVELVYAEAEARERLFTCPRRRGWRRRSPASSPGMTRP